MPDTTKTTVYLDANVYRRLRELARARGRTAAECVREALAEYTAAYATKLRPRSVGSGRSGRGDVAARAEFLLKGMGRKKNRA